MSLKFEFKYGFCGGFFLVVILIDSLTVTLINNWVYTKRLNIGWIDELPCLVKKI
jgi:hypothetical protein